MIKRIYNHVNKVGTFKESEIIVVAIQLVDNEALVFHNKRMAARRIELGLLQAQASEKAGMKQGQWTRYEVGLHAPGSDALVRIARALECSTDYLLGLTDSIGESGSLTPDERRIVEDWRISRREAQLAVIDKQLSKYEKSYRSLIERAIAFLESKSEVKDLDDKP